MQEETTSTSPSQQETTNEDSGDNKSYSSITSNEELVSALESQGHTSPSELVVKILSTLKDGQSVVVHGKRDPNKSTNCCIAAAVFCTNSDIRLLAASSSASQLETCSGLLNSISISTADVSNAGDANVATGSIEATFNALNEGSLSATDFDLLLLDESDKSGGTAKSEDIQALIKKFLDSNPNGHALVCLQNSDKQLARTIEEGSGGEAPSEINSHKFGGVETTHEYYEIVTNDLLSKPNSLCDVLQVEGLPPTAIFCNTPSDADLLDAILTKRGISSRKLIGNIPYHAARNAVSDCVEGKYNTLVVTDVSGQALAISELDVVVNYSVHEDPEVYMARMGKDGGLAKVISLVTPLDFSHFHFLKKFVKTEFVKCELPSAEALEAAKFTKLCNDATSGGHLSNEELKALIPQILESDQKEEIIAYLLHNTIVELPELRQSGGRRKKGHNEREDRRSRRHSDRDQDFEGEDRRQSEERERRSDKRREPQEPPKFDIRYYLGHGLDQGITEDKLAALISEKTDLNGGSIKRISVREAYSFVDFDEENHEAIAEGLKGAEIEGNEVVLLKATAIAQPREAKPKEESEEASTSSEESAVEDEPIAGEEVADEAIDSQDEEK